MEPPLLICCCIRIDWSGNSFQVASHQAALRSYGISSTFVATGIGVGLSTSSSASCSSCAGSIVSVDELALSCRGVSRLGVVLIAGILLKIPSLLQPPTA